MFQYQGTCLRLPADQPPSPHEVRIIGNMSQSPDVNGVAAPALSDVTADPSAATHARLPTRPLGRAVAQVMVAALAVVTAGLVLALWGFRLSHLQAFTSTVLDLVKLSFALVAGLGGTVGLVLAYRRHQFLEAGDVRERAKERREDTRLLNERFSAAAAQLASDQAGVRFAGIYAMAGLADDWDAGRQKCIDVLCVHVRRGHKPRPVPDAQLVDHLAWQDDQEFRHTITRVITAHLVDGAALSWQGCDFDFTGATMDGGDFKGTVLSSGTISFAKAKFTDGEVNLRDLRIVGGLLDFRGSHFDGGAVVVSGSHIGSGGVIDFSDSHFAGGTIDLDRIAVSEGGILYFCRSDFDGATIVVANSQLSRAIVDFRNCAFASGAVEFDRADITESTIDFRGATFGDTVIQFDRAHLADVAIRLDPEAKSVPAGIPTV